MPQPSQKARKTVEEGRFRLMVQADEWITAGKMLIYALDFAIVAPG